MENKLLQTSRNEMTTMATTRVHENDRVLSKNKTGPTERGGGWVAVCNENFARVEPKINFAN